MKKSSRPDSRRRRRPPRAQPAVRRLPLASLRVFIAVAEQHSFARAAEVLGVTTSAVTLQIQTLEGYLGVPLVLRQGRQIELTVEGARLLPRVSGGLREIQAALEEARQARGTGPLKISMLASFLQQWLMPRLSRFRDGHPAIDLRIHTSVQPVIFEGSDIQAAIRVGAGNWPQLYHEKLLDDWLVPVCHRELRNRNGWLQTGADLDRFPLLHALTEPWDAWISGSESEASWAACGNTFDDSVAVIRAAEAGQGLALARWRLVEPLLRKGELVQASRRIVACTHCYFFVCPPEYVDVAKVRAFRDWLRSECAATESPPGAGGQEP